MSCCKGIAACSTGPWLSSSVCACLVAAPAGVRARSRAVALSLPQLPQQHGKCDTMQSRDAVRLPINGDCRMRSAGRGAVTSQGGSGGGSGGGGGGGGVRGGVGARRLRRSAEVGERASGGPAGPVGPAGGLRGMDMVRQGSGYAEVERLTVQQQLPGQHMHGRPVSCGCTEHVTAQLGRGGAAEADVS